MSQLVSLATFDLAAPTPEWREVADLFVASFSAAPYFEDEAVLRTIVTWGPAMLSGNGRLVTARMNGVLVGFALGHNLASDASWQKTLSRIGTHASTLAPTEASHDGFVVHELAVADSARGRGIARACMRELLTARVESQVFVGTYERAVGPRAMYQRWGFEVVGQEPMRGGAIALHVLTSRTSDAVAHLASTSREALA